ncbi:MAG: diguanylate cyclase [Pseudotabrizicola sp.]|uniref:diguanylate cyclase n=2 Tax=Pseudotabrizicola sp. TaxID=2939647 RepID=UPI00272F76D1|nr:diguanylate cyclase [Pseudotabrizicola sp.]MDP2080470.1 diguanylate cyclase [Pseudotabrizicola sp.]MDZ7573685.1 diguanylate cyclase [Pseudotabrizicola sp.]
MDGRILIIDDVATNRIVLKVKLGAARYHPMIASGGVEGLRMARAHVPDLILLDLILPDLSGIDVLRRLREDPVTRDIPVIVVSSSTALDDRLAAFEAGADDVFVKPYDDDLMLARLRNLLRGRQELTDLTKGHDPAMFGLAETGADFRHPGHLVLVTDRPEMALKLRHDLSPIMRDTISVLKHANALSDTDTSSSAPDIYVIDADGAQSDRALRLLSDLRSRAATRHAGICLITSAAPRSEVMMGFDLGADAILNTDQTIPEIALRLRAVLRSKRRADLRREQVQDGLRLAVIDPLTGLFNRRYATARLTMMAERAVKDGRALAVMVADIDRFKSVNDRYGHAVGDDVLIEVSHRLGANLRADDLLARIGGEEFLVALPFTTLDEAQAVARRLCNEVERRPVLLPGGEALSVTVSIGLTLSDAVPLGGVRADPDLVDALIDRADQALLASKRAGRNQVTLARNAA